MRKNILLLLLLTPLIWACSDDDEMALPTGDPKLVMSFHPFYENEDMQFFTKYNNVHDCTFELSMFKFYLSNIALHGTDGDTVMLSDIEMIDFRENMHTLAYTLPGGAFDGISFDLGVPVHLNGTQNPEFLTSVYSLDHPLSSSNGTYWTWQSGYRFFMVEGRFDTIPEASGDLPTTLSFHTGRDTLFRHVGHWNSNISTAAGAENHLQFALDFEKFFAHEGDTVDLRHNRDFHGAPAQMELGHRVANNTAALFRLLP